MSFDPHLVTPLSHRLLVELTPLLPPGEFSIGYNPPSSAYYSPLEVPAYVRRRLLAFLHGLCSVPPAHLDRVLPKNEVPTARRLFQECLASGMGEGEALMTMGLLTKPMAPSAAPLSIAEILNSSCDCVKSNHVLVRSNAGEPIGERIRLVRCSEAFSATEARTLQSVKKEEAQADARRRQAFHRARLFKVS